MRVYIGCFFWIFPIVFICPFLCPLEITFTKLLYFCKYAKYHLSNTKIACLVELVRKDR